MGDDKFPFREIERVSIQQVRVRGQLASVWGSWVVPGDSQRGQTVGLFAVFAMCLLGMCALAIDVGTWYQDKRHLSADADAAALAGAAAIPTNSAIAAATANFTKNRLSSNEQATVTTPAFDTVTVKTTYQAPTFFAKIFGKNSTTITATATARIRANGVAQHHVSPYVVTLQTYNNGQGTVLFSCDASGNCGTVDLPMPDNTSGGSCSGNVYTGITTNVSGALTDTLDVGQLVVGGCLSPKTGNSQPSANAVNNLPGSLAQDLQSLGGGQYQVTPQSWDDTQGLPPRLIYVPIVQSFATGTNANVTILFFAWFYITGATGSGQGLHINGQYVSLSLPASATTVDWVPGRVGQVTSVMLTG